MTSYLWLIFISMVILCVGIYFLTAFEHEAKGYQLVIGLSSAIAGVLLSVAILLFLPDYIRKVDPNFYVLEKQRQIDMKQLELQELLKENK